MLKPLKVYIIAGEPSGDYLGSCVIKQLLNLYPNGVSFYGVGGNLMESTTLNNVNVFTSLFNIKKIAIMGFVEVFFKIFKIKKLIKNTANDILSLNPDIVLTIDSLGFNKRVVKLIKPTFKGKIVHLVAPTVWAWKPKRVFEVANLYNHLMCLFNFELPYFTPYISTSFVGHPIVETINYNIDTSNFMDLYGIDKNKTTILLMPGSRLTEVKKLLPIFINVVNKLNKDNNNLHFVLPTVNYLYNVVNNYIQQSGLVNITVINNVQHKYQAFRLSKVALVASGTATLELALYNVNCVVAYKVNGLSSIIAGLLIKVKYASIINIMANKEIIPEFIQKKCTSDNLHNKVKDYLNSNSNIQDNKEVLKVLEDIGFNKFTPSKKIATQLLTLYNEA